MNKLFSELERLYFLPEQTWLSHGLDAAGAPVYAIEGLLPADRLAIDLLSTEGLVRALLIDFKKSADWSHIAHLYEAIQSELGLPAPAVSISGSQGIVLWMSLAEPVPVAEASAFLKALSSQYLTDIPEHHLGLLPGSDNAVADLSSVVMLPCTRLKATEMWSAFIDPTLGSMFVDEPWLEMAPNVDRQASILAGLESIEAADYSRALGLLLTPVESESSPAIPFAAPLDTKHSGKATTLNVGNHFTDPASFLLAVMNDASVSAKHRIKAAKALLKARAA